jgi:hypothetical protein
MGGCIHPAVGFVNGDLEDRGVGQAIAERYPIVSSISTLEETTPVWATVKAKPEV